MLLFEYLVVLNPFPNDNILQWSKLKEFADDNFEFDENGRKLSKRVENTVRKRRNCSLQAISPFSHSVFRRLVLQTRKKPGLVWERVKTLWFRDQLVYHDNCFSLNVFRSCLYDWIVE